MITARIHDYYQKCSALPKLAYITKPTLIIHAKDDPFMAPEVVPDLSFLPHNVYQIEHGGHVATRERYLEETANVVKRIPQWLTPYLDKEIM